MKNRFAAFLCLLLFVGAGVSAQPAYPSKPMR